MNDDILRMLIAVHPEDYKTIRDIALQVYKRYWTIQWEADEDQYEEEGEEEEEGSTDTDTIDILNQ